MSNTAERIHQLERDRQHYQAETACYRIILSDDGKSQVQVPAPTADTFRQLAAIVDLGLTMATREQPVAAPASVESGQK